MKGNRGEGGRKSQAAELLMSFLLRSRSLRTQLGSLQHKDALLGSLFFCGALEC